MLALAAGALLTASGQDAPERLRAFPTAVEWAKEIAGGPAAPPVVADNRVVVALRSGGVIARRLSDGEDLWTASLLASADLAAGDDLIVVPVEGAVHGLDAASGDEKWKRPVGRLTAPPLVRGGWVILAAGDELSALRAADGAPVWSKTIALIEKRPAIDGDALYLAVADGRLLALDLASGSMRWELQVGANPTEPLAYGDRVYLGATGKHFVCVRAANGVEDWRFAIGAAIVGAPAADPARIYTASMDNLLRAFRRSNGALDWKQDLGHRPSSGPLVIAPVVTVAGRASTLRAFDARTGRAVAQLTLPLAAVTAPAIAAPGPDTPTKLAIIANDLGKPWLLVVAAEAPPSLSLVPLTALPGTPLPMPKPPQ